MPVIFVLIGLFFGAAFASGFVGLFGALMGAFAGYALSELISLRRRADSLEQELAALHKQRATERVGARTESDAGAREHYSRGGAAPPAAETASGEVAARETAAREVAAARAEAAARASASAERAASAGAASATSAARVGQPPGAAPGVSADRAIPPAENPIVAAIREYFTGGNTLVRVGVVILFIGVAFLLRYIAEHTQVPIQLRLSGVAVAGVVLLALGWRLRKKRPGYALALQGGAIGILYLTVFASLRLFSVMSPGPAFAFLVLLSAFSAALGVLQNSLAFSLLAVGCGFLAPVLASSGQGNHVILFSYYGILNLAILAIAWFKTWRPLNVAGFLFTFVIGTAWGVLKYKPEFFWTTEPFLVAFFLLYVIIAILFSVRQQPVLKGYVDGTIVFGVPAVAFALQAVLVRDMPFVLAYSAAATSAMYLTLAWVLHKGERGTQRLLVEAFMALGVVFLTLTIPLALDGRWSAATWALEGAALVWIGCRQGRRLPRAFGSLLQIASGVIFLYELDVPASRVAVLNSAYLGGVMIALGSVFVARLLTKYREDLFDEERFVAPVLFLWGLGWWLASGLLEIEREVPGRFELGGMFLYVSFTALICSELKVRFSLPCSRVAALMLLPAMILFAAAWGLSAAIGSLSTHPATHLGWVAWPVAFAVFYFVCRRHEGEGVLTYVLHVASAWLLVILLTWEFAWQVDRAVSGSGSWPAIGWALVPGALLFALPKLRNRVTWPVGQHADAYIGVAGAGIAVALIAWSLFTNFSMRGDPHPLPYVPLLNPLDLAQAFVLLVLVRYWLHVQAERYRSLKELTWQAAAATLAALAFIWLNAVLLRTLHQWAGVPFELEGMLRSTLVQTSLSIFWTILALAAMLVATRRVSRVVWLAGAVLLGVVVAKLFLIDLSRVGTVERIVSFVGVGLLMLVVGYFSPLPPAREQRA
jgi:uncharacterized membrane protein